MDIDKAILKNIDIGKEILENIDIDNLSTIRRLWKISVLIQ